MDQSRTTLKITELIFKHIMDSDEEEKIGLESSRLTLNDMVVTAILFI